MTDEIVMMSLFARDSQSLKGLVRFAKSFLPARQLHGDRSQQLQFQMGVDK